MPKLNYLFPTHFFSIEQVKRPNIDQAFTQEEYDCIMDYSKTTHSTHHSGDNKYVQISQEKNILNNIKLRNLKDWLTNYVQNLSIQAYSISDEIKMTITNSWIIIGDHNQKSILHNHHNSLLSGVLYINAKGNEDNIIFSRQKTTDRFTLDISNPSKERPPSPLIQQDHKIIVNTGDLLIFSSHTYHMIDEIKSKSKRISLVFSVFPYGVLGYNKIGNEVKISL